MMVTGWASAYHFQVSVLTAFTATASFLLSQQSLLTELNFSRIQYDLRFSIILIPRRTSFLWFIVVHKGVTEPTLSRLAGFVFSATAGLTNNRCFVRTNCLEQSLEFPTAFEQRQKVFQPCRTTAGVSTFAWPA
jgi:hypothetical protein